MAKRTRKTRVQPASAGPATGGKPAAARSRAAEKKAPAVSPPVTGPALRWFVCERGDLHVYGPCPSCFQSGGGMLTGSTLPECRGIARARCAECGEIVDYFVDAAKQQAWKAEAIREPASTTAR